MHAKAQTEEDREIKTTPHLPKEMRAIVQRNYGSSETLEIAEIDLPQVRSKEVLVEVHAAGVDRGVWHLMTGLPYLVRVAGYGITRPRTQVPGLDASGRVVRIGDEVTCFKVGDEVFGIAQGAYAEYAVADEAKIAHKPSEISFEQAAVSSISGITALQALTNVGHVKEGDRVLVIGASGGVGTYAVQLAKAMGAIVTGVASAAKADMVRSLGADRVVDYATDDYLDGSSHYDLIIDIGGLNPVRRLRRALEPKGTLVIVGGEGGGRWIGGIGRNLRAMLMSPFVSQRLTMFISSEDSSHIDRLAEYLADGSVVPAIGERYPLDQVPAAIRRMEAGELAGKTLIRIAGSAEQ